MLIIPGGAAVLYALFEYGLTKDQTKKDAYGHLF